MSAELLRKRLDACAQETAKALEELLPPERDPARLLNESMRYSLLAGGKRLRAFLTLTFCELCGGKRADALHYAAGLEMMHAFSLIHDDLPEMDNDTIRRGKPTNHMVYGSATALLAGDALALKAVETVALNPRVSPERNLLAVRILSSQAGYEGMCGGQQIDLQSEHEVIPRDVLEQLVDRKTGALFAAACMLGCISGPDDPDAFLGSASRFGRLTGLAFQIADDLLDLHATAEELGKTPGKDLASEKSTFPALLGEEEAKNYAASLCREAKKLLDGFPDSEPKSALVQYCEFILSRQN
ncbi:MAG: polyprenyl synthetase family protein [Clostridia bacterium]|nr:polyprenyl synthetase family protein [Clostridia bacterium]